VDHISPASKISIIGELAINEWNNIRKPQIFIQDVAVESWQLFDHRGVKRIHSMVNSIPKEKRTFIIFNKEQLDKMGPALTNEAILIQNETDALSFDIHQANVVS
jgi:single-stranded-DNA-specific exonuclease